MTKVAVTKIIVLDDDPTGSQTVHSCPLLTQWDPDTLRRALYDDEDDSPICFILTNTRGMSADRAAKITQEVCQNVKVVLQQNGSAGSTTTTTTPNIAMIGTPSQSSSPQPPPVILWVSRSDSTLRGHYPIETNVIANELGPFDAHFLVPAFFEGGRITRDSTHYLVVQEVEDVEVDGTITQMKTRRMIPCHETEFAKDSVFGYSTAFLPDYVEEKTKGVIPADQVQRFLLHDVRGDCSERLANLSNNVCCVVDCEQQSDLDHFCSQLKEVAATKGRRFLFRSGASLLTALAQLPPQPVSAENMGQYVSRDRPAFGAILVGSHVQKSTLQLSELLKHPMVTGIQVDVNRIRLGDDDSMLNECIERVQNVHGSGRHVAIYTSRTELTFDSVEERLDFGEAVSAFLMKVVQNLPPTIAFLISKGGITSNDVLSIGLALRSSRVLGQILPGCSVVRCPGAHPRHPHMPVVIFPGKVGDDHGLVTVLERLSTHMTAH